MHFTYFVILNASLFSKVELPKIATDSRGRQTGISTFLDFAKNKNRRNLSMLFSKIVSL